MAPPLLEGPCEYAKHFLCTYKGFFVEKNMNKEGVLVEIDPKIPEPYQGFIRARNGQIGTDIAQLLGIPYRGYAFDSVAEPNLYIVTSKTLTKETAAKKFGSSSSADFYGLAVGDINDVGKAILHPTHATRTPSFYRADFAEKVRRFVLPGLSCFSPLDAQTAYHEYANNGFDLRFKVANESDGNGQYKIDNPNHLKDVIDQERKALKEGVVIEANLNDPNTISLGFVQIGQQQYSFIAHQKNTQPNAEGQSKYLGANVTVVRGPMEVFLKDKDLSMLENTAALQAIEFNQLYQQTFRPYASRLSYDVVTGFDNHGNTLSGVTDITGRVGGTCPALMVSLLAMQEDPSIQKAFTEVTLNYQPTIDLPEEKDAKKYVNHPNLRITARTNEIMRK